MNFIEWYNTLSSGQQVLTWILVAICGIGVLRLIWFNFRYWILDILFVNRYLGMAKLFAQKFRNNNNNAAECTYLLRMREKVTNVLGNNRIDFPEIDLAAGIKYKSIYSIARVDDLVDLLYAVCLEWDQKRKSSRWLLLIQLLVPVLFWLFRGIEAMLMIIVYFLKEIGFKSYDNEKKSKVIRILSTIFTFITGMASLLSYLRIELW